MKKAGTIIAAMCLTLAMGATACAAAEKESFKETGFSLPKTEVMENTKGFLLPYTTGAIDLEHHVYALPLVYYAAPSDLATKVLYSDDATDEETEEVLDAEGLVGLVLSTDTDFDTAKTAVYDYYGEDLNVSFDVPELASAEGFTFYYLPATEMDDYLSSIDAEYAEEYKNLETALTEAFKEADFYEPKDPIKEMAGQKISFTTTDIDGNTITSEELFSQNEITMLNCWGLWCHNCVDEMEELAAIHTRMQEKGCGIVGAEYDDPSRYEEAKEMMTKWGTNYPNVLFPQELRSQVSGFPTSIFVDREGTVLGIPIVGAAVKYYETTLDALLAGEQPAAPAEDVSLDSVIVYHVNITDENGPVEGVGIQMCSGTACRYEETEADGTATFEVPRGEEYEIHVQEVPEGYEEDETLYHPEEGSSEINIQIRKKA
jgi:thiol-disulfide isomerase/thioredoxin